jgi:hypothetical protein
MSKDPAFLFYPNDYIGGTMGMTFEEKGAYMELLMLQFNRGHMTTHMIGHMENVNINVNTKDLFINNIKEYEEILGDSFTEFVEYWCEPNKNGKLRYELEKFFDVKRRINTWTKNKLRYGNSKTFNPTATSKERMDALAKWVHS